ncbi:CAF17-like 4Fe-4S cluster assembly/insertion protein YgfZ [Roseimaritima sediminicola]|uniref:CAF17-like 4Fe-4S cluster assembly/insertion protein YgfZ n=1 Tax=Roseimaritima sediminicola TaxID=2662066 RepID=UPI00138757CA|nr:aminomethyltransferase [Roseimaritima sediminicola]
MYYTFASSESLSIVDIIGDDAVQVVNNLCTAPLQSLAESAGLEAFITEVRGRTVGHGCLFQLADRLRFIGAGGQAQRLVAHIDRYIIREDARPEDRSQDLTGLLLPHEDALVALSDASPTPADPPQLASRSLGDAAADAGSDSGAVAYQVPWLNSPAWLVLGPPATIAQLGKRFAPMLVSGGIEDFHPARIQAGFPWFGVDLDESNLPQEADRDAQAISFTKGCYLGQETVARLDALGQVQKKLVRWQLQGRGELPAPGTELVAGEKTVGKITSITAGRDAAIVLAMTRRSHFDVGSRAEAAGMQAVVTE